MTIDFGKTAADYASYRPAFDERLIERLWREMNLCAGLRALDVGAGTGLLSLPLAERGLDVTMIDPAEALLRSVPKTRGLHRLVARAEQLPFGGESFDAIVAAQCWHWLDRTLAPKEMHRVLRPGGAIGVVYQTYIPLPGSVAEATERVICRFRSGWRHINSTGINGQVFRDLQINGFGGIESFSFEVPIKMTHDQWRGYIRSTSAVGASMSPKELEGFDREHTEMLAGYPPELDVPHRAFVVIARRAKRLPANRHE